MRHSMKKNKKILYCTGLSIDKPLIYVLRGEKGDMLIDTGTGMVVHQVDRWIRRKGFDIKWIFLTHGHFDHTWNARFFKEKYGAKILLHEYDRPLYCEGEKRPFYPSSEGNRAITKVMSRIAVRYTAPACEVDRFVTDADTGLLREMGFDADIVMLHGHTLGSMGILQGRVLYAGDSLSAKNGDYYTAMFGEDVEKLLESEKKIFELEPLIIAPGHGYPVVNERARDFNGNNSAVSAKEDIK